MECQEQVKRSGLLHRECELTSRGKKTTEESVKRGFEVGGRILNRERERKHGMFQKKKHDVRYKCIERQHLKRDSFYVQYHTQENNKDIHET